MERHFPEPAVEFRPFDIPVVFRHDRVLFQLFRKIEREQEFVDRPAVIGDGLLLRRGGEQTQGTHQLFLRVVDHLEVFAFAVGHTGERGQAVGILRPLGGAVERGTRERPGLGVEFEQILFALAKTRKAALRDRDHVDAAVEPGHGTVGAGDEFQRFEDRKIGAFREEIGDPVPVERRVEHAAVDVRIPREHGKIAEEHAALRHFSQYIRRDVPRGFVGIVRLDQRDVSVCFHFRVDMRGEVRREKGGRKEAERFGFGTPDLV